MFTRGWCNNNEGLTACAKRSVISNHYSVPYDRITMPILYAISQQKDGWKYTNVAKTQGKVDRAKAETIIEEKGVNRQS